MLLKVGTDLFRVLELQHVTPGNLRGFVRVKFRNIRTSAVSDQKLRSEDTLDRATLEQRDMQYLYKDGSDYVFMDGSTYDQIHIPEATVGDVANYLLENQMAQVATHDGTVLYVELPTSVILEITYTEPGLQGDRSTGGTKPATVETGYEMQVPLFVEQGTKVKVDTRSGDYLGRVS